MRVALLIQFSEAKTCHNHTMTLMSCMANITNEPHDHTMAPIKGCS